jgi:SAM-dependent methyltransferase
VRLNRLGRASMNNPARAWLQRTYIARLFERLGGRVPSGRVLEVGSGRGAAVETLRHRFGAREVVALDVDPRMIARARRLLRTRKDGRHLVIADVTAIPAADASFDAVFDFGAIHFVADWGRALDEVRRVLRPGGRYFFEWVTGRLLRSLYPLAAEGFERMRAPSPEALLAALEERGIRVGTDFARPRVAASVTYLVGDVIGVGRVATS